MITQLWWWWCDRLAVQWSKYRRTIIWLLVWLVVGVVLAVISIIIGNLSMDDINHNLVDANILNMASVNAGIGSFLWQRLLSLFLPILLLMVLALISRFTALIIFPIVLMHGYWLCMSFWWTFMYYSFNAIFLLIFYLFWLALVTAILFVALLWALQIANQIRENRGKCPGIGWQITRGILLIAGVGVVLGFLEYLIFLLILGRIVYKPV